MERKEEDGTGDKEDGGWEKEASEAIFFSFNYFFTSVNLEMVFC